MVRNGQENFDMVPRDRASERACVRACEPYHLVASYSARAKFAVPPQSYFYIAPVT